MKTEDFFEDEDEEEKHYELWDLLDEGTACATLVIPNSRRSGMSFLHMFRNYYLQASGNADGHVAHCNDSSEAWSNIKSLLNEITYSYSRKFSEQSKNLVINIILQQVLYVIRYCHNEAYFEVLDNLAIDINSKIAQNVLKLCCNILNDYGVCACVEHFTEVINFEVLGTEELSDELVSSFEFSKARFIDSERSGLIYDKVTMKMSPRSDNTIYKSFDSTTFYGASNKKCCGILIVNNKPKVDTEGKISLDTEGEIIVDGEMLFVNIKDLSDSFIRDIETFEDGEDNIDYCYDYADVEDAILALMTFACTWLCNNNSLSKNLTHNYSNHVRIARDVEMAKQRERTKKKV